MLRIWWLTAPHIGPGVGLPGHPDAIPRRIACLAPEHQGWAAHPAFESDSGRGGRCTEDGRVSFLYTACVPDCPALLASSDFANWWCAKGHAARGLLCPLCAGIGTFADRYWWCPGGHRYRHRKGTCRHCRIGLVTAADRMWRCQFCGLTN
ncbi:hypothetical protein ACQP2F_22595 [Actinoplanes sp. CA-030573]|uniref:hypothetical protein n=1 Tax=Actinoplanes sp. CA-030573 TaxID=3239898 RepID=UPI003D927F2B